MILKPAGLTFHHLHILQRKLPEELVFTGGVDCTCCWISERQDKRKHVAAETTINVRIILRFRSNRQSRLEQWQRGLSPLTYRLMELRLNEPDFLLRVVQMIKSLKRNRERSFFPPTVFCRVQMMTRRCYQWKNKVIHSHVPALSQLCRSFVFVDFCVFDVLSRDFCDQCVTQKDQMWCYSGINQYFFSFLIALIVLLSL